MKHPSVAFKTWQHNIWNNNVIGIYMYIVDRGTKLHGNCICFCLLYIFQILVKFACHTYSVFGCQMNLSVVVFN